MVSFTDPLDNIKIASPCSADWDSMLGDNRKRYCGECRLNVYNLSGMSRAEAENLLMRSEGRVCVRYFRRADGTVLTEDCPVGWKAAKQRLSRYWTAVFSLLFGLFGGIGLTSLFSRAGEIKNDPVMGAIPVEFQRGENPIPPQQVPVMGDVMFEPSEMMGKVSNFDAVKREVLAEQRP